MLVTDHKPLITTLGPKTGIPPLAAVRLQKWSMLLSSYIYFIEYRGTKFHGNTNGLSRLPLAESSIERLQPNTSSRFNIYFSCHHFL